MFHFLPIQIRFVLGLTLSLLLLFVWTLPYLVPLSVIKICIPHQGVRKFCTAGINQGLWLWAKSNRLWMTLLNPVHKWDVRISPEINQDDWYLVLANHQSASDIILMMWALAWKSSNIRFIAKREVALIPIIGWVVYAMDCPLMKRYSREKLAKNPHLKGQDLATTRRQCRKFAEGDAVSLVIYPEGTRFTPEKFALHGSNYRHLLNPKAGGPLFALLAMEGKIQKILDVTIVYETWERGGFLSLISGNLTGLHLEARLIDVPDNLDLSLLPDNPALRGPFHEWLNALWQEKDQRIKAIRQAKGWDAPLSDK